MAKGGYLGGSTLIGPRSAGWFGSGSPTMQPASKKAKPAGGKPKPKKPKAKKPGAAPRLPKGNGLTIPEQVARARQRVDALRADIARTRKRLADLDQQLLKAQRQLEAAQVLPRRSAIGRALAEAPKVVDR